MAEKFTPNAIRAALIFSDCSGYLVSSVMLVKPLARGAVVKLKHTNGSVITCVYRTTQSQPGVQSFVLGL